MGDATAVIGLRVKRSQIYEEKETKGCEHEHHSKFCPECGAEGSTTEEVRHDFVKEHEDESCRIGKYRLLSFVDNLEHFVVKLGGVSLLGTNSELSAACLPIMGRGAEINTFEEEMTKVGLWDPNEFGVWASYSY